MATRKEVELFPITKKNTQVRVVRRPCPECARRAAEEEIKKAKREDLKWTILGSLLIAGAIVATGIGDNYSHLL